MKHTQSKDKSPVLGNVIINPKINCDLFKLLGSRESVKAWWISPNALFELKTPLEVHKANPENITKYLEIHSNSKGR